MSKQSARDQFISETTRAGIPVTVAWALLRKAATAQRLAEAQCNGDWPYDNGERKVTPCPSCESGTVPSQLKRGAVIASGDRGCWSSANVPVCPDCRNAGQIAYILADANVGYFARLCGDPRGYVVRLYPTGTPEAEIQNGRARGIGVPA